VAIGRRAHDSIRRHLLHAAICAALLALCVCCCAIAATAPAATLSPGQAAKGASSHAGAPAPRARRPHGCARRASYYTLTHGAKGKRRRAGHAGKCRRHAGRRRHSRARRHGRRHPGAAPAPVPLNGVCANGGLRPSSGDLPLIRTATLCLVNRERIAHGEVALKPNARLALAAQGHSADMAAGDYFEHDGRHGDTPLSRMRASGYIFSSHIGYAVGENIAWATLWLATPKAIVAGWMASPDHRANILDATFRETGLGVSPHPLASLAHGQAGAIYTQDFGRIVAP
jgi:uncharacterized protein YkwD